MQNFHLAMALILLLTIAAGLWRVMHGPTAADRMLAIQLFGSTGVALVLLLAFAFERPGLIDVALIFALLAAIVALAFVRLYWRPEERS